MRVLVIGTGWAGLAAAVEATRLGHHATVLEATRATGGRARALKVSLPDGTEATLDNGQHILIGAYSETLQLMRDIGIDTTAALHRLPLTLRYPDNSGLALPDWRKPWFAGVDVAAGIFTAKGWTLRDKLSLLRAADAWRRSGFTCPAHYNVAQLCKSITPRVMADMIEPLVVSALNIASSQASASIYLRVMRDALFAPSAGDVAGSNMLLPRTDLGTLLPAAAQQWLREHGADVRMGERVSDLNALLNNELLVQHSIGLEAEKATKYDAVVIATPPTEAARLVRTLQSPGESAQAWAATAEALQHTAITTVYAYSATVSLPTPVMALRSNALQPAQFVFDRGTLSGQRGVLAFVVSASEGDAATIEQQVIAQGQAQLGLADLQPIKTIVEKRATFACTPGVQRPAMHIAQGLLACGDYVDGPYPATLEGAVRSGLAAARAILLG
jgi:hydroxysqualene dehydroxylase